MSVEQDLQLRELSRHLINLDMASRAINWIYIFKLEYRQIAYLTGTSALETG